MGFEPTTLGFGVQCSTVGATPSELFICITLWQNTTLGILHAFIDILSFSLCFIILRKYQQINKIIIYISELFK